MNNTFQYIDISQLETLASGDNEFIKEMAEIFLEQIDEFVTNMSSYLQEKGLGKTGTRGTHRKIFGNDVWHG